MAKKCFILVSGNTLSWWILGTCCLYLVHHLINIVSFKEIKKLFDLIRFHFNALCQGKIINAQSVSFHKFKTCLSNIYLVKIMVLFYFLLRFIWYVLESCEQEYVLFISNKDFWTAYKGEIRSLFYCDLLEKSWFLQL